MANYIDWTFYTVSYGGTAILSTELTRLGTLGTARVDELTFDRASEIITAGTDVALVTRIKFAVCAAAEEIKRLEAGGEISSESVGGHSVSYAQNPDKALSNTSRISRAIKPFLGNTGLMYRGFDEDEYGSNSL